MASNTEPTLESIMKVVLQIQSQLLILTSLQNRISRVEDDLKEIKKSQEFLSDSYDDERIKDYQNRIKFLEEQNTSKENDIIALESKLNQLEQYGRRSMLEINGVKKFAEESTDKIVVEIAECMNVDLNPGDIEVSHRLSRKENAGIIVKFISRKMRDAFLNASRKKILANKDIGIDSDQKIFINKSLTRTNKDLLFFTKQHLKSYYKYIWFSNEQLMIRKENGKSVSISGRNQIMELVKKEQRSGLHSTLVVTDTSLSEASTY